MEQLILLLGKVDVITLLAIAGMFWIFNNKMNAKIENLKYDLENKIEKLSEDIKDIDRRLCRIEGSLASKDCCMLKEDRQQLRKAE